MPEIQQLLLTLPAGVEKTKFSLPSNELVALRATKSPNPESAVLCLPGFTGSKEDYCAILSPLSEAGFEAIAYDQRGQFESKFEETPGSYKISALAGDAIALAKSLNKKVHLIGHSLGGLVAAHAIMRAPQYFSSLTMLCSGPGAIPFERQRNISAIRKGFPKVSLAAAWKVIEAEEKSTDPNKFSEAVWVFRKNRWMNNSPQALHEMAALLQDTEDFSDELTQVLSANKISALVLTAENDDIWPLSVQQQLANTINAKYLVLPDAGHSPARETPAQTASALIDFYKEIAKG
jgi:pimeloyl-ACP methyl ester carboxylesterase